MKDIGGLIFMGAIVGIGYLVFKTLSAQNPQTWNPMTSTSPLPNGSSILNPSVSPTQSGGYVPITIPNLPATGSGGGQITSNCVAVGTGGFWCN